MGNASFVRRRSALKNEGLDINQFQRASFHIEPSDNNDNESSKDFIPFLSSSWPGSILNWSKEDLERFASCFTPHCVKMGEEIVITKDDSFFIVVKGAVEVHAVLPTKCKKTQNIREFLCKKDVGDMLYMKSMRKLILESNARDLYEREESGHCEHREHKRNIFDIVDTITIISAENSTILQINWAEFDSKFDQKYTSKSDLNVGMLRTIMHTNVADYLVNIPVFENLPNSKLELVSRLCHYDVEKEGAIICKEGDRGEEVFILLSGEVKVETMASKRMVELFEKGILSPLEKTKPLPPEGHSSSEDSYKRKASVTYLCDFDDAKRNRTKTQKSFIRRRQTMVRAGHILRREKIQKSNDDDAVVIDPLSRLDVPDTNHTVELARFKAGDYFGEISTFIELPRAATVTATTNVLMVSISKNSFRTLYHCISPDMERDVEKIVKQHMLQNLLQSKSPFLEVIGSEDAKRMANLSTIKSVKEGEVIFNEGDEAHDFNFVYSGQLSVFKSKLKNCEDKEGQLRIGTLYSGDYFGEMSLLNQTKRLATIVATSTTVLMSITREKFYECFQETPQLIAEFIVRMKGFKVDLDSLLNYSKSRVEFTHFLNSIECHALSCYDDLGHISMESLLDKYFKEDSTHSIDDERIREFFKHEQIRSDDFLSEAKKVLKEYLENNSLPKFKESTAFALLTKRMRAYDEIDVELLA